MGKKKAMKLPLYLPFKSFKETSSPAAVSSWPWPTCATPKTVSFRASCNNDVFKTMNSAYLDGAAAVDFADDCGSSPDLYYYINPFESESLSSVSEPFGEDSLETVIRGLRDSERLFFEPGETSSILVEAKLDDDHDHFLPFKESVAMAVDSRDPFADFRRSMEEMVEVHGLKDWECLEELLTCYLKVNGKSNHGYIVGAFVDLLVSLAFANSSSDATPSNSSSNGEEEDESPLPLPSSRSASSSSATSHSFTSPLSFSSSATSSTSHSVSLVELVDDEMEKSSSTTLDIASSSSFNNIIIN